MSFKLLSIQKREVNVKLNKFKNKILTKMATWEKICSSAGLIGAIAVFVLLGTDTVEVTYLTAMLTLIFALAALLPAFIAADRDYSCTDAIKDIDLFYKHGSHREDALIRALAHMTAGSEVGKHNIACQRCWDYHMQQKRIHCGG